VAVVRCSRTFRPALSLRTHAYAGLGSICWQRVTASVGEWLAGGEYRVLCVVRGRGWCWPERRRPVHAVHISRASAMMQPIPRLSPNLVAFNLALQW
jgi:hypothetical protein